MNKYSIKLISRKIVIYFYWMDFEERNGNPLALLENK